VENGLIEVYREGGEPINDLQSAFCGTILLEFRELSWVKPLKILCVLDARAKRIPSDGNMLTTVAISATA
jgi:hypothetical protein